MDMFVGQKGSAAMPTATESAGVAPELNLKNPLRMQESTQVRSLNSN